MVCRRPRPHSRAGTKSLKGLSSRAGGFSAALWGAWPSLVPHTGSAGKGLEASQGSPGERRAGSRKWGRERAGLRDACPGAWAEEGTGMLPHRLPLPWEGHVPKPPCLGRSLGAERRGEGGKCFTSEVFASYSALLQREPLVPGDELSHAYSHSGQETKGTERLCNLPRATQLSTEGTGHQLHSRHCHGEHGAVCEAQHGCQCLGIPNVSGPCQLKRTFQIEPILEKSLFYILGHYTCDKIHIFS